MTQRLLGAEGADLYEEAAWLCPVGSIRSSLRFHSHFEVIGLRVLLRLRGFSVGAVEDPLSAHLDCGVIMLHFLCLT